MSAGDRCACGASAERRESAYAPPLCATCWASPARELARLGVRERISWRLAAMGVEELRCVEALCDMIDAERVAHGVDPRTPGAGL